MIKSEGVQVGAFSPDLFQWRTFKTIKLKYNPSLHSFDIVSAVLFQLVAGNLFETTCIRSHRRCSVRKIVLRNFEKFTGKHLCQSLFFNKVAGFKPVLWHKCFPVNFVKFLRTTFLQNSPGWLLLNSYGFFTTPISSSLLFIFIFCLQVYLIPQCKYFLLAWMTMPISHEKVFAYAMPTQFDACRWYTLLYMLKKSSQLFTFHSFQFFY